MQTEDLIREHLPALFRVFPFSQLSPKGKRHLASKVRLKSFSPGQEIQGEDEIPLSVYCIVKGQARVLGPAARDFPTITVLNEGVIGWDSLLRRVNGYSVRATGAENLITLVISADDYEQLLFSELADKLTEPSLPELYDIYSRFLSSLPANVPLPDLREVVEYSRRTPGVAIAHHWFPEEEDLRLEGDRFWFYSGGCSVGVPPGTLIQSVADQLALSGRSLLPARFIGIDRSFLTLLLTTGRLPDIGNIALSTSEKGEMLNGLASQSQSLIKLLEEILAPEEAPQATESSFHLRAQNYPIHQSSSDDAKEHLVSCFWMVCDYLQLPYRPDILRRQLARRESVEENRMNLYASIAEVLGMTARPNRIPATAGGISRLTPPCFIIVDGVPSVLYEISPTDALIGSPVDGLVEMPLEKLALQLELTEVSGSERLSHALLLNRQASSTTTRFGWRWFAPFIKPYRGILLQILVASIFVQLLGLASPLLTQQIIDKVIVNGNAGALPVFGILLVAFTLIQGVLTVLRTYLLNSTTNRVDLLLGTEIVRHLYNLPMGFFQKRSVGELSARFGELEKIRQFLTGTFITVVLDVAFSVVYIGVMLIYSIPLTICVLATIPLVIGLTLVGSPIIQKLIRQRAQQNAGMQSYLVETLNGIFTVKAETMEPLVQSNWQERYVQYLGTGFRTTVIGSSLRSISDSINTLSSLLVLWVGGGLVLNGQLTLGGLIAFRIIAGYVTGPLIRLSQLWQQIQEVNLSKDLLADIIDAPPEYSEEDAQGFKMPPIKGNIRFESVNFGFEGSSQLQLNDVSLKIDQGAFVGLVGQTGSGKSTLIKILYRLYPPNSGSVYLDGYDISKANLKSLRQQIGFVPQDAVLFDGTIRDNITQFASFSDEAVIKAAQIAEAHDFISAFPRGYDSPVGERGSNLSGGQKQRVAIARMVLQNPNMVILDEATSALDYETERRVVDNLMSRFQGKTVLCITHRLANLRRANQIFFLQSGVVVEQGTHLELMEQRGLYYGLYIQQATE